MGYFSSIQAEKIHLFQAYSRLTELTFNAIKNGKTNAHFDLLNITKL